VAHTNINNLRGYQVYDNIGTTGRGTAILTKVVLDLYGIKRLPTGRGISAYYNNTCILNIYAPPGAENRAEREMFYNTAIIDLMPHTPTEMIMAGDFNSVASTLDCTGHRNNSRALQRLLSGLGLVDVWEATDNRQLFTHYTPTGIARLHRLYVTWHLR